MQIIKRFFSWWAGSFKKRGCLGKIVILSLSAIILLCLCSVPIAIISPSSTSTPTQANSDIVLEEEETATLGLTTVIPQAALPTSSLIPSTTPTVLPTSTISKLLDNIQVSFIDVGQGDAILIRSPEGLYGLIDGGDPGSGAVQYLQSQGVTSLDLIVATHPHSDHIGGLISALQTFPTARVFTNGEIYSSPVYEDFIDAITASDTEYSEVTRGDTINLGSLMLIVLSPGEIVGDDLNRNSVVLRMTYGNTTFLFAGDANFDAEAEMIVAGMVLNADIFKVGHHTSNTSTSPEFLSAVSPRVAVYTVGKGNGYGLPSPDTLLRLENEGSTIYGTENYGTIEILVDKSGYVMQTEKQFVQLTAMSPSTTQAVTPASVAISVVSLTSPISPNSNATLTIQTTPGADCSISVIMKSGPSGAVGLGPQTADASGFVTWSWRVGPNTTLGVWSIVVKSQFNGITNSISIPFEVK